MTTADSTDLFSIFIDVPPGLVATRRATGEDLYVHVASLDGLPAEMNLSCAGYELDGTDSGDNFGTPVFFHNKMEIRHFGTVEEFLARPDVTAFLVAHADLYRPEAGILPILRAFDRVSRLRLEGAEIENAIREAYEYHNRLVAKIRADLARIETELQARKTLH